MHTLMSFGYIGTLMNISGIKALLAVAFGGIAIILNGKPWTNSQVYIGCLWLHAHLQVMLWKCADQSEPPVGARDITTFMGEFAKVVAVMLVAPGAGSESN